MQISQCKYFAQEAGEEELFRHSFNSKPFLFTHSLHTHPLFSLSALKKLAGTMSRAENPRGYFWLSEESRGLRWGSSEFQDVLAESFDNIETSKMRLKLSSIHLEPDYDKVLEETTAELSELTSVDLVRTHRQALETLFITSPNEVTPYHVDSEANFLLQIYGTKTVYIFDGNDRELLDWRELEEYWHGNSAIQLRPGFQSRAIAFELRPGVGVHNPIQFPHWVQNGGSASVSLSFGYPPVEDSLDVLRVNRSLRRWGLNPTPPGESKRLDNAKRAILTSARSLKQALRRG